MAGVKGRGHRLTPVAIRALKRFAEEHGHATVPSVAKTDHRVAIIGSGPSGLAAACFLALNGVQVTILETKDFAALDLLERTCRGETVDGSTSSPQAWIARCWPSAAAIRLWTPCGWPNASPATR